MEPGSDRQSASPDARERELRALIEEVLAERALAEAETLSDPSEREVLESLAEDHRRRAAELRGGGSAPST